MISYRCPNCWGNYRLHDLVYSCANKTEPNGLGMSGVLDSHKKCSLLLTDSAYTLADRPNLEQYHTHYGIDLEEALHPTRGIFSKFKADGADFRFRPDWWRRVGSVFSPAALLPCPRCGADAQAQCPRCWETLDEFKQDREVWPIAIVGYPDTGKTCTLCAIYHKALSENWSDNCTGTNQLRSHSRSMFGHDLILPSKTVDNSQLDLFCPPIERQGERGSERRRIWLRDYPGEDLVKAAGQKSGAKHLALTNMLETARGYIFLVSLDDAENRLEPIVERLISFSKEMPAGVKAAVCIAQADKHSGAICDGCSETTASESEQPPQRHQVHRNTLEAILVKLRHGGIWETVKQHFGDNAGLFAVSAFGHGKFEKAEGNNPGKFWKAPDPLGVLDPLKWLVWDEEPVRCPDKSSQGGTP